MPLQPHDAPAARMYSLTVSDVTDLNPRMRRVAVCGDLRDFAPWPGQDVVLHLVDDSGAGVRRRYTVRHLDSAEGSCDLDFVMHGHGPGARWAERARVGDRLEVFGPRGKVALSDADWQLFAGDESALPAIAEMAEALPAGVRAVALIEVGGPDDEQPINPTAELDLRWLHRGATPAGASDVLDRAVSSLELPAAGRHACLFGESRVVRRLRDALSARGLAADEISAKGYWNLGRAAR